MLPCQGLSDIGPLNESPALAVSASLVPARVIFLAGVCGPNRGKHLPRKSFPQFFWGATRAPGSGGLSN